VGFAATPFKPDLSRFAITAMIGGRTAGHQRLFGNADLMVDQPHCGMCKQPGLGAQSPRRLEAVISGPEASVRELVERCRRGPPLARVAAVSEAREDAAPAPGFRQLPTA
jgi:hypothetical protein